MPDIPAEAVQAAAKASSLHFEFCDEPRWQDCAECVRVVEQTERGLKAAAPFMAGVGSPVSCPSAAPESTQSPETTAVAPVYPPALTEPSDTLSAPRGEDAHPLASSHASEHAREHADLRRRYADALATRDDELADARRHAAQAEAALIAEVARTCGADLDAPRIRKELPNVAALALDAARDLRADCEHAWAQLEHAEAATARVRERLDALIAAGFGATTQTLRDLRALLDGAGAVPEHTGHACGNCEGIDPASCINAPRPPASTTEETTHG